MPHPASPSGLQSAGRAGPRTLASPERHRTAVASSVASAHECAARGDYVDALSWVAVLDAIGELPLDLKAARPAWHHVIHRRSQVAAEALERLPAGLSGIGAARA